MADNQVVINILATERLSLERVLKEIQEHPENIESLLKEKEELEESIVSMEHFLATGNPFYAHPTH